MKEKNVGWVEQSETEQNQGFFVLGFVPQTPLALSRQSRPTQWLPNLPRNLYSLSAFLALAVMLG
ncbi:hypothetical protein [Nostoc sp.]